MDAPVPADYCSFTKAIEHLGDRWSLLLVRQLGMVGPEGFNELARALPGRISRSVLAERLRRLESLGVVAHDTRGRYRLTTVGEGLVPVLVSLRGWAETWLPEDPSMVERDPDVVLGWLARRVRVSGLPHEAVVLEIRLREPDRRLWLVVQEGVAAYGCLVDPMLEAGRYLYLECALATLLGLASGRLRWEDSIADCALAVWGDPVLRSGLPGWFVPVDEPARSAER